MGRALLGEELADETIVRAFEKWDDRVVTEATFAWLFTVGRNLLRRTRSGTGSDPDGCRDDGPGPSDGRLRRGAAGTGT